jgi:uncharacterized membrane protein
MMGIWQAVRVTGLVAGGAIYLWLGYIGAASENPPLIALLAGLLPLVVMALAAAWHSKVRWVAVPLCVAACAWAVVNLQMLRGHTAAFYFVQHVGAMGLLTITFGSTLWGGHDKALCSRIAAIVIPGPLEADYLRYTWQVTLAWTLFFVSCGSLSAALFFFGALDAWAIFANVVSPILIGVMFVGEYLVRQRVLPNRPHLSIAATIQAYQKFRESAK